jgi:CheY-like chemotaxis protein
MSRILLVDDDPDILHILTASLESAGHEVRSTLDPREVADLVAGGRFDAVVLDVMMPRRSGWEILEELRREPASARLPVLMLSAIGDPGNRVRGLRLGADDFLAKPFHPEELIERIEKMVRSSAPEALSGDFATLPISEVLQSLAANAATGALEIVAGAESGRILLAAGKCVGVTWEGLQDVDAFLALFETRAGTFRFHPGSVGESDAGLPPIQNLLLEAAWISDELRARESWLPPPDQPLLLASRAAALRAPDGLNLPTQAVVVLLQNRPGAGLADILGARLGAPSRVRLAVACLLEAGLVTVAPADGPLPPASKTR